MISRILRALLDGQPLFSDGLRAVFIILTGFMLGLGLTAIVPQPQASAEPCTGTWTIGIAGLGDNASSDFWGKVHQPVGYNTNDPQDGLWELNRLFWQHRDACPGDYIKMIGHSEGAGILHVWINLNPGTPNASGILLADPKRSAGPGADGMAVIALDPFAQWVRSVTWPQFEGFLGWPLAGTDDVNGIPYVSLCRWDDWVCNTAAFPGYSHVTGLHGAYDFFADHYANGDDRGKVMI